jgi:acyl-coenzyme A thioesterase PaaI-like protein
MEASEGDIVFAMPAHKWLTSPQRAVQGGVLTMFADAALNCAILTSYGPHPQMGATSSPMAGCVISVPQSPSQNPK